jgi:hypothetical protein
MANDDLIQGDEISITSHDPFWAPTKLIRWKRIEVDNLSYKKTLQQMWQSGIGELEWRDVPEEN